MDEIDRRTRLEAWFRADADRVLAFLQHRTDADTAQDVLQEVFVIAYHKAEIVPDPATGWLFATARRVLANTTRGQRRRDHLALRLTDAARVPGIGGSAAADASGETVNDLVSETLAALSTADREVLTISAWYELTADEAARALGCTRAAYNVRLHRARRRFADRLRAARPDLDRSDAHARDPVRPDPERVAEAAESRSHTAGEPAGGIA